MPTSPLLQDRHQLQKPPFSHSDRCIKRNRRASMLASRDQENFIHARQTAAAAKPVNQGIRALQPKTPGNNAPKTPFKVPLNDENHPLALGGKNTVKVHGNQKENLMRPAKDGIAENHTFITPLGMSSLCSGNYSHQMLTSICGKVHETVLL